MPKRKELVEIATWIAESFEKRMKTSTKSPRHIVMGLMLEARDLCDGQGIGGVVNKKLGVDLIYLDRGDPYIDTIIYDCFLEKFLVGKWGEMVEVYQMLNEHELKAS